jgi:hypothetical protein
MAESGSEESQTTGSGLRAQLEAALAAVASLTSENVSYKAKELISAKGYKHVTPEQLKEVKPEELEAKADELEQAGAATEVAVLTRVLTAQGLSAEDLESSIKALTGTSQSDEAIETLSRVRSATQLTGTPPPKPGEEVKDLHGPELIRHAYRS